MNSRQALLKFIQAQEQKRNDISKQGFKRNSPYVNEQELTIYGEPNGTNITMQDVDFPLLGIDEFGNKQYMKPGEEYFFPGSRVKEIPLAQIGGKVSPLAQKGRETARDSVDHQADKILKYEQLRGGPGGTPLPQYSNPQFKSMLMNNIYPEVKKIMPKASAMEIAEAMDFIFNAGWDKANNKITKDPRAFALQEYYRQYDPSKLDSQGKWSGRKNAAYSFDQEYANTIGKLPENKRRILMNKGRDWYYRNINNPSPGVPSSDYYDTWYGRIWNTNDYLPFNPNNPNFIPRMQTGGKVLPATQTNAATRADSLAVYNNARAVENYYKKQGYKYEKIKDSQEYKRGIDFIKSWIKDSQKALNTIKKNPLLPGIYTQSDKNQDILNAKKYLKNSKDRLIEKENEVNPKLYLERLKKSKELFDAKEKNVGSYVDEQGNFIQGKPSAEKYYLPVDENKFYQREQAQGFLDLRSPMPLYDKRITPQNLSKFMSPDSVLGLEIMNKMDKLNDKKQKQDLQKQFDSLIHTDNVEMYDYDPLAIMPFDMVPLEQQEERVRKYGTSGVPASFIEQHLDWVTKPTSEFKQRQSIQKIENNLQPKGVQIQTSFPVIRPQARTPKYYDVEDVVNNGRSQTNYQWYPSSGEALRQLSEESGDRRTMVPRYQGGGLLNKTITCSNCGWSWKAADGGNDVTTCHKCGNENKIMQFGGDMKFWRPVLQNGGENMFTVSGNNPMIIPSQGSYPLSYKDRGDRDIDGTLFSSSKKVSRFDANGRPLTRNQIAENQIMWNMQKEAYGPQQQAFNIWKNNPQNTAQGYFNPKEYYDTLEELNSQPDVQLQGLETDKANKKCDTKGSCTTGDTMGGDSLKKVKSNGGLIKAQTGMQVLSNDKKALEILADIQKRKQRKSKPSTEFSNVKVKNEKAEAVKFLDNTVVNKTMPTKIKQKKVWNPIDTSNLNISQQVSEQILNNSFLEEKQKQNYGIIDKKNNIMYYVNPNGEIIGYENVITGATNKDRENAPSMLEYGKTANEYYDYLKNTNQRVTPAGIFTLYSNKNNSVGKPHSLLNRALGLLPFVDDVKLNTLDDPSFLHALYNEMPWREQEKKDYYKHRKESYGSTGNLLRMVSEYGVPSSKALHGTGNKNRILALNDKNADKNLSNGCINVGGKTKCFDILGDKSKLYILPEEKTTNDDFSNILIPKELLYGQFGRYTDDEEKNYVYDKDRKISREDIKKAKDTKTKIVSIIKNNKINATPEEIDFVTGVAQKETKGGKSWLSKLESALPGFSSYGLYEQKESFPYLKGKSPNDEVASTQAVIDFYRDIIKKHPELKYDEYKDEKIYSTYNSGKEDWDESGIYHAEDFRKIMNSIRGYKKGGLIKAQEGKEVVANEDNIIYKIPESDLEEVVVKPSEFSKYRMAQKKAKSWEQFANERYLGNFERNMGQTINNLPAYRKQEYENYIDKLAFDEYVKTHPSYKGEKRGAYIDRIQKLNEDNQAFERAYKNNAQYNPSTDINLWRKGLMGLGSLVMSPDAINRLKKKSDYFSTKEKQYIEEHPVSSAFETTLGTFAPLEIPANMMYGKNNTALDALSGRGTDVPIEARILGDPLIVAAEAAPLISKGFSVAGKTLGTQEGLLSNTWKINPFAEKLNDANKSYRVAGLNSLEDFKNTGVLRSRNTEPGRLVEGTDFILPPRPTSFPSFQKGYADMAYAKPEGSVVFETALPTFRRGDINPVTGFPIKGRHYAHRVIDPVTGKTMAEIPASDIRVFGDKPHWLQGYQEIKVSQPSFKSEINWGKWNAEIPQNKALMDEYLAIEQQAKANGNWMKNPDGSAFQGTPEQFVQYNSENFKKAFPQGVNEVYRGVGPANNNPDFSKGFIEGDRAIFTADKNLAKAYASGKQKENILTPFSLSTDSGIYHLGFPKGDQIKYNTLSSDWTAINLAKTSSKLNLEMNLKQQEKLLQNYLKFYEGPQDDELISFAENRIKQLTQYLKDFDNVPTNHEELRKMRSVLGDTPSTDDIAAYLPKTKLNNVTLENVIDGGLGDVTIVNNRPGNYLKSMVGNNGMFDMSNPNIYKSVLPIGLGLGAAYKMQQKKQGGSINNNLTSTQLAILIKQQADKYITKN